MPSGGKKRKRRSRQLEAQYEKKVCDSTFYMDAGDDDGV